MKRKVGVLIVLALAGTAIAAASAQNIKPDRAIKLRQGVMEAIGLNMGIMGAMVKGERPYHKDEFLLRATNLEHLASIPWEGFVPGSDQGGQTKAKPDIWKDAAKFKQDQDALLAAAPKLAAAAKVGTLDAVKGPFGDVGKACKNCHDNFREQ
jgi:cytochrome c556